MRQLTLIRHGLTDWNTSGRFQGHSNIALSDEGRAQARSLGERLTRSEHIDIIYTSPLRRAVESAEIALPNREFHVDERLMELNFGSFEGHTLAENQTQESWQWWYSDPFKHPAPGGGESYEQLRERAVAWFETLPQEGRMVAFTHSGTIQMLLSHILGVERPRWRKRIYLRHTSLTHVLFRGKEMVIERVNDTRHLERESGDPFAD